MYLQIRMIGVLVGLAAVSVFFLAGVWFVCYGVLAFFAVEAAGQIAVGVVVVALAAIGYLEYGQPGRVERLADANVVDSDTAPELYQIATRVAAQLDVPVPTIAVSERDVPEALVTGFRPKNVTLVLSLGTIAALDAAELEAVIAHELAHVANRDAMVMTAASVPVVLAEGMGTRLLQTEEHGYEAVVTLPLAVVSALVWLVGRMLTAGLSRAREAAADRAAAEVTESPATLAGALVRLDREIEATPVRDLREVAPLASLSILPYELRGPEKVLLGSDGDVEPTYWWRWERLRHLVEDDLSNPSANRDSARHVNSARTGSRPVIGRVRVRFEDR